MDLGLTERVALVTGASSGIGAELATAFGREGARVAITYHRDPAGAERTANKVQEAGGRAMTLPFDLTDPASARTGGGTIIDRWTRIDVLVANAIVWPNRAPAGGFEALTPPSTASPDPSPGISGATASSSTFWLPD